MNGKNIHTFIGADNEYDESRICIFGVPFDGTTSYRPGARFAPAAIRNESYGIETYSPYLDKDLNDINIYDCGDMELPFGNTERVLDMIEEYTGRLLLDKKIPVMIGGEHLVTLGTIKAFNAFYKELHIIHFDAHTDLRDEYLGEKLSHATVIRRCRELLGKDSIYQFGIRSGDREEFIYAKDNVYMNKFDFNNLDMIVEKLKGKNVYLTIDLDILDSSNFPGTGTPEAGGVTFKELLKAIYKVTEINIVGADICELSPVYDQSGSSTALACKILRELLLSIKG